MKNTYERDREKRLKTCKEWHAKNKEKVSAWRKSNRELIRSYFHARRAREISGGKYTPNQICKLHLLQRGCCAICNGVLGETFHRDHIVPLVLGGTSDITNIQLLCAKCNLQKGSRDPIKHMQSLGKLL